MDDCQTLGIHEAYRIARAQGFKQDTPVSYMLMTNIVIAAYKQGLADAKAKSKKRK